MRRFLLNFGVLSSLVGAVGVTKQTISGPRDWRLILMWIAWVIGVALAVGTVIENSREADELEY